MQQYPSIPAWKAYTEAVATLERLTAERRQAHDDLEALRKGKQAAVEADNTARATALRTGAKDPGPRHLEKYEKDLKQAQGHAGMLDTAVVQQKAAVEALLHDERELAIEGVDSTVEQAQQAYDAALNAVLEARNAWWAARQVRSWLVEGLPQGRRYKGAAAPSVLVDPRPVRDWSVERPEVRADDALAAFRAEFSADERREVERYVQQSSYDESDGVTTKRFVGVDAEGKDWQGNQVVRT